MVPWEQYMQAGNEAYQRGEYEKARNQLEAAPWEVEATDPRLATSLNNLANLHQTQGGYAEAQPLH